MYALPAAPAPVPRRQVFVGTAVGCLAGGTLMGGMLALWLRFRAAAPLREGDARPLIKDWLPADIKIPEVPSNVMLITFAAAAVMAQWAVYATKRRDRSHATLAIVVTALLALAAVNAQVFIYTQMDMGVSDGAYQAMFYAITGTFTALVIVGLVYSIATVFRVLGGRDRDTEVVSGHAMYWYFITAAYTALWFVVYVQK
jgi:cytochrome c oxidase subunit III